MLPLLNVDRRQIETFFCLKLAPHAACYSSAEFVILLRAACNDVLEHAYLVYSSVSVDVQSKKIIQNKK